MSDKQKIQEAYEKSILERKFDLGSGTLGNGISVWNRAKEVHGDYEKIAHIDRNRKITYYIKNPPREVKKYVEGIAKGKNPRDIKFLPEAFDFTHGPETQQLEVAPHQLIRD